LYRSPDGVVVPRHRIGRARDPVGELGQSRLGDDDGACIAKVLRQRRFVRRHEAGERERAAGRRHVGRVNVVLQCDGDAVQRTADSPGRAIAIESIGLVERVRVHHDCGVQPILVGGEPDEILMTSARDVRPARRHRGAHLRDGGFDEVKRLVGAAGR
jgi:hypothetical protein